MDLLRDLARRLRDEAKLMDVEGEGIIGTTDTMREAARALELVMPTIKRAHEDGWDAGRCFGWDESRGDATEGWRKSWEKFRNVANLPPADNDDAERARQAMQREAGYHVD